ncbi:MAG: pyridoxal kinase [Ahrensia sp.]|nr:pyridoxal kinase [Ahrensia sp.]
MTDASQTIVAISSHVVRGAIGNRAIVFALETLGFPVWSVPTVILPWHPGHGPATRIKPDEAEFRALLADLAGSKFGSEVRAVISGYMGSVGQVEATAEFVRRMKSVNPSLFYVCDPVIGDVGGLYVKVEIAAAMRTHLLPLADLITPNRFELAWLLDKNFASNDDIVAAVRAPESGLKQVLATSAFAMLKASIGNLYIDNSTAILAEHAQMVHAPNGTGDLTAALFSARILSGSAPEQALQLTTQSVSELLQRTAMRGADELTLALDAACLRRPTATVHMRKIATSIPLRRGPRAFHV